MTTAPYLPSTVDATLDPTAGPPRIRVVAGVLFTAAAASAVLVATHPWGERLSSSADELLSYDVLLRSDRNTAWASLLADGFALALVAVCASLATCLLARQGGRNLALIGSILTVAGGVLVAMGSSGYATLTWFVMSDGLSEDAGRGLIAFVNDTPARLIAPQIGGFLLVTLGGLVLASALGRAKAVPLAAVVAFVVLTLALFAPLPGGGAGRDVVQVLQMLLIASLAVPLWRRASR